MAKTSTSVPANIGLTETNKQALANALNQLLADETVLYIKTRKFHWNVEGPQFHDLHLFLENQYTELAQHIDDIAERIRKIGHYALGSLKQYLEETNLDEHLEASAPASAMIQELLDDHETIIRILRDNIDHFQDEFKDAGSADFITSLMQAHEHMAWMLRATLH
jgi:starvation-inducible DNA-binding protein